MRALVAEQATVLLVAAPNGPHAWSAGGCR